MTLEEDFSYKKTLYI